MAARPMEDGLEPSVAVIMPAYNEADGIADVVHEWHAAVAQIPGAALVVLNDGSRDRTGAVLDALMPQHPRLAVVHKPNSGHSSSCRMGYWWAIERGFEFVFQTDSDGQTLPDEFIRAWRERETDDFIFGRRGARGDGLGRVVISRVLRLCLWILSRQWIPDGNVPFRLMRCARLRDILREIPEDFYLGNVLLTCLIAQRYPIRWIPITFQPRTGGEASVRMWGFARKGLQFIRQYRAFARRPRSGDTAPQTALEAPRTARAESIAQGASAADSLTPSASLRAGRRGR